jgi:tRNA-2-methylthio-N6-dimethylallyladenosine synthase
VTVQITEAKPFYLIADEASATPFRVRRTRAGAAWDTAQAASCGVAAVGAATHDGSASGAGAAGAPARVSLGLPTLRVSTSPIYDPADGQR